MFRTLSEVFRPLGLRKGIMYGFGVGTVRVRFSVGGWT